MKKNKSLISSIMPAKLAYTETLDAISKLEEKAIVKLTNDINERILSAIKNGNFATTYLTYTDYSDIKLTEKVFNTVIETFSSKGYNCELTVDNDGFVDFCKIWIRWNIEENK